MFAWTYQPTYQLESTVFFSHNKTASANLSAGLPARIYCVCMFNAAVDGRPNLNVSCVDGSLVAWKVKVTDAALKVKAAGGQTLINLASNLNWRNK